MKTAARAAIILVVCSVVVAVVWVLTGHAASQAVVRNASVVGGIAGVLALLVSVVVLWPPRQRVSGGAAINTGQLATAIEYLAEEP